MDPDLVIFGALHRDLVGVLASAYHPAASNPVHFTLGTGGVGANVARAVVRSKQVESVCLVVPVGAEGLSPDLAATGFEGIDICPVAVPATSAGRYVAIVDSNGDLVSGFSDTSACESAELVPLISECPPGVRTVVLDANLSQTTLKGLATSLPILRFALAVSPSKAPRLIPVAKQIDTLFCNRREAAAMTGLPTDSASDALATTLLSIGFTGLVLTDGAAAVTVCEDGKVSSIETPVLTRAPGGNANGAGDALAGATIAACHAGMTLGDAVAGPGFKAAAQAMEQG